MSYKERKRKCTRQVTWSQNRFAYLLTIDEPRYGLLAIFQPALVELGVVCSAWLNVGSCNGQKDS